MPKPQSVTVLLTCAGAPLAVETIRALKSAQSLDIKVIGTDLKAVGGGVAEADLFFTALPGDHSEYAQQMAKICEKEGVDVIIPTSDEEALAIAAERSRFENVGTRPTVPRQELIPLFADKVKMYRFLKERGIEVPEFYATSNADELKAAAGALGYPQQPFVIKPASARGGRGVWEIREGGANFNELMNGMSLDAISLDTFLTAASAAESWPRLIAMPCLKGDVFDVDILSESGELKLCLPRRRFHPRTTPFRGCILEEHREVIELSKTIQSVLQLDYLHDIDVMLDAEGVPHLLEVNPRQSGSLISTVRAGVNLPELLVRRAMDLPLDIPQTLPFGKAILPSIRTTAVAWEALCAA